MSRRVPLIFGVGGSGTRIPAQALQNVGFQLGESNKALDFVYISYFTQAFGVPFVFSGQNAEETPRTKTMQQAIKKHISAQPRSALKNNHVIHFLTTILSWFPNTFQLVHVIRDGRDMAYSDNDLEWIRFRRYYLSPSELSEPKPVQRAVLWRKLIWQTRDTAQQVGVPYQEMFYEDILEDPEEELMTLLRACGSEADPDVDVRDPGTIGRWREQKHAERVDRIVRRGSV